MNLDVLKQIRQNCLNPNLLLLVFVCSQFFSLAHKTEHIVQPFDDICYSCIHGANDLIDSQSLTIEVIITQWHFGYVWNTQSVDSQQYYNYHSRAPPIC